MKQNSCGAVAVGGNRTSAYCGCANGLIGFVAACSCTNGPVSSGLERPCENGDPSTCECAYAYELSIAPVRKFGNAFELPITWIDDAFTVMFTTSYCVAARAPVAKIIIPTPRVDSAIHALNNRRNMLRRCLG